jgi:HEAT repeat protein/predicted Ser/Thr protein kinase
MTEAATLVVEPGRVAPPAADAKGGKKSDAGAGDHLELEVKPSAKRPVRSKFGRYIIQNEIARGGMGIVYKAYDPDLQRVVALKVLIAGEGADVVAISRFLREARSAGSLRHPNIITIYEVGEAEGQTYFTMEYVEGKNLADIAKGGGVPIREMIRYVRDVCVALAAVHHRGIIHRDLKPENIMVDKDGRALVMDFGLAKDVSAGTVLSLSGAMLGTPSYMSPEQAQGNISKIDHRTDIYSIGVILYELATGRRPFEGNTVFDTIEAVVHEEALSPLSISPQVDKDLSTIIMKCMEKAPEARYQTMEALVADINRYLEGEPIQARPVTVPELVVRKLRKKPVVLVSIGAGVAVLLVALLTYMLFAGRSALPVLEEGAKSDDPERIASAIVTLNSLFAEGKLRGESDVRRGLSIAASVVGGKSAKAEAIALDIIAREQDAASLPVLLKAFQNKSLPAERRACVAAALGRFDPAKVSDTPPLVLALSDAARDSSESVALRTAAIEALGVFWSATASKVVTEVATDDICPVQLRLAAVGVLGKHVVVGSPTMHVLLELQGDENPDIVAAAERGLSHARTGPALLKFYGLDRSMIAVRKMGQLQQIVSQHNRELEELLNGGTENQGDKPKAAMDERNPVDVILEKLNDADPAVRLEAAYDLGNYGDEAAIPALTEHLTDTDNSVRRSCARALIKLAPVAKTQKLDIGAVAQLLGHQDPLVRENAAYLLGQLEAKEAVMSIVIALEKEQSPRTVRAMARALGDIREPMGLNAIRQAMDRSKGETAEACIKAMIPFGRSAVPHLIGALSSPSKDVRGAAVSALKEVTGEDYGEDAARWRSWLEQAGS